MRNNDHKTLMEEFDTLTKAMAKSKKVFETNGGIPRFLVRMLCDLEDHVQKCLADKASFKKLKPAQGRALNRMKLSLKKFCEAYRGIMEEYRKNPIISESDASSSSSSSSSESEDESDDDDASSSSSSSSDSSASEKKAKKAKADSDGSDSDSDSVSSFCFSVLDAPKDRKSSHMTVPRRGWNCEEKQSYDIHLLIIEVGHNFSSDR